MTGTVTSAASPSILSAVPDGRGAALEVGCGDEMLAGRLAQRAAEATSRNDTLGRFRRGHTVNATPVMVVVNRRAALD
jgi:hypothetical protein